MLFAVKVTYLLCTLLAKPEECKLFKFEFEMPQHQCSEVFRSGSEVFARKMPHWEIQSFKCYGTEQA